MNDTTSSPPDCKCPGTDTTPFKYPEPAQEMVVGGTIPAPIVRTLTVTRLYNLGDYEHKKIEVTVDVPFGTDPSDLLIRLEKILEAIGEEDPVDEYTLEAAGREAARTDEEFQTWHGTEHWKEAKEKAHKLLDDLQGQREAWKLRQRTARTALNFLNRRWELDPKLPFEL